MKPEKTKRYRRGQTITLANGVIAVSHGGRVARGRKKARR
jgi:hypothetical protein